MTTMKALTRIALLCALAWLHPAHAARWDDLQQAALRHYQAGDYAQAEAEARAALALAEAGNAAALPHLASSLNMLALARSAQGAPDEARPLLERALAVSEQALGAHPNTASLAHNLGSLLEAEGWLEAAAEHHERGLAILDGLPETQRDRAGQRRLLQALERIHAALGRTERAEAYARPQRAETDDGADGTDGPLARARAQTQLALNLQARGRHDEAARLLEQALALHETQDAPAELAQALAHLAALYGAQGLHERALPLHRRALALRETLDPQAPELAVHLNELALWHTSRGEHGEAAALFERARALLERQHGAASLDVARVLLSQAASSEAQARYGQAEALYVQALAIYAQHGGEAAPRLDQAQALNNLAGLHYRRRRFTEAETLYLRALALREQAQGADSPALLPVLENLLALYRSQRRDTDAQAVAQRAEALRERLHAGNGG